MSFVKNNNGNVAIEAALILPIFLFILFGLIEYGFYFFTYHRLSEVAYECARIAAIAEENKKEVAYQRAQQLIEQFRLNNLSLHIDIDDKLKIDEVNTATQVTIEAQNYAPVTFLKIILPDKITVKGVYLNF